MLPRNYLFSVATLAQVGTLFDYSFPLLKFTPNLTFTTGLQLDVNQSIMKSFPVAKQLWLMLSPFFHTIKQSCLATLEREDLTAETASKCLASILILENCSMNKLLTTLIQLRSKAFKQTLAEDSTHHQRVQSKILTSLKVLIDTLNLIYNCFIDTNGEGNGLVMAELKTLTAADAQPTIALINIDDAAFIRTLPDIISKYK